MATGDFDNDFSDATHGSRVVAAEVVEVERFVGVFHHVENAIHTVADLHVRLFLQAVTEDL